MIQREIRIQYEKGSSIMNENKIIQSMKNALVLKLEKGNNLRIFCRTTTFKGVKEIIKNTISKSKKVEHLRNEVQERRIHSESIRVKVKDSRKNEVIYTFNISRTESSSLINRPQTQKFILEVVPIIQLWGLESKTAKNISE